MARASFPFFLCLFLLAEVFQFGYISSNHRRLWSARRTSNDTFFLYFRNLDITRTSALGGNCSAYLAFVKHFRSQKIKPHGLNDAHKVTFKMGSRAVNASSTTSDDKNLKDTLCTHANYFMYFEPYIFSARLARQAGWTTRLVGSGMRKRKG